MPTQTESFSQADRERFINAVFWGDRELLALCLGVPRYADRDDIAPAAVREAAKARIKAAMDIGDLRADHDPHAAASAVMYGSGAWRIRPIDAIPWASTRFANFPDSLCAAYQAMKDSRLHGDVANDVAEQHLETSRHELPPDVAEHIDSRLKLIGHNLTAWDDWSLEERRNAIAMGDAAAARQRLEAKAEAWKQAEGRYTIREAAEILEARAGERVAAMKRKLGQAITNGLLAAYEPGRCARYEIGPGLDAHRARTFYEEIYWSDLNAWLDAHESRVTFRFAPPLTERTEDGNGPASPAKTIKKIVSRDTPLSAEIEQATRRSAQTDNVGSVWGEPTKMAEGNMRTSTTGWDAFISHASEDKDGFVRPLAELLQKHGLKIWYDEFTLKLGDSLRRSIDKGLALSRFGIVVISPDFIRKEWPQRELDGLTAREIGSGKVILPIWHNVNYDDVLAFSPPLADRLAVSSASLEKVAHEILRAIRAASGVSAVSKDAPNKELMALGPNIVCEGEILSAEPGAWHIRLDTFVEGDFGSIIRFAESFDQTKPIDRYVILTGLGDGRVLTAAPSLTKDGNRTVLKCPVATSAPRMAAQDLPARVAVSPKTNDLYLDNGDVARVSGVASLPQSLRECVSMMKGEALFARAEGARLQEYYWQYRDTPYLESMLKLDLIRLAAIPYDDAKRPQPPLLCVERVWSSKPLVEEPMHDRIPMVLDLGVKGLGRGEYEVSVLMPPAEAVKAVTIRQS